MMPTLHYCPQNHIDYISTSSLCELPNAFFPGREGWGRGGGEGSKAPFGGGPFRAGAKSALP